MLLQIQMMELTFLMVQIISIFILDKKDIINYGIVNYLILENGK